MQLFLKNKPQRVIVLFVDTKNYTSACRRGSFLAERGGKAVRSPGGEAGMGMRDGNSESCDAI